METLEARRQQDVRSHAAQRSRILTYGTTHTSLLHEQANAPTVDHLLRVNITKEAFAVRTAACDDFLQLTQPSSYLRTGVLDLERAGEPDLTIQKIN